MEITCMSYYKAVYTVYMYVCEAQICFSQLTEFQIFVSQYVPIG